MNKTIRLLAAAPTKAAAHPHANPHTLTANRPKGTKP